MVSQENWNCVLFLMYLLHCYKIFFYRCLELDLNYLSLFVSKVSGILSISNDFQNFKMILLLLNLRAYTRFKSFHHLNRFMLFRRVWDIPFETEISSNYWSYKKTFLYWVTQRTLNLKKKKLDNFSWLFKSKFLMYFVLTWWEGLIFLKKKIQIIFRQSLLNLRKKTKKTYFFMLSSNTFFSFRRSILRKLVIENFMLQNFQKLLDNKYWKKHLIFFFKKRGLWFLSVIFSKTLMAFRQKKNDGFLPIIYRHFPILFLFSWNSSWKKVEKSLKYTLIVNNIENFSKLFCTVI